MDKSKKYKENFKNEQLNNTIIDFSHNIIFGEILSNF